MRTGKSMRVRDALAAGALCSALALAACGEPDARITDEAHPSDLYVFDAVTRIGRRLVWEDGVRLESPRFAPDGRSIAVVSSRDDDLGDIWVMRADGTERRNLTPPARPAVWRDAEPAWSPDGSRLAFVSWRSGRAELWTVQADGTGARRLADAPWCPTSRAAGRTRARRVSTPCPIEGVPRRRRLRRHAHHEHMVSGLPRRHVEALQDRRFGVGEEERFPVHVELAVRIAVPVAQRRLARRVPRIGGALPSRLAQPLVQECGFALHRFAGGAGGGDGTRRHALAGAPVAQ
jgi:hypothetical protein